jgi:hypothetical protein
MAATMLAEYYMRGIDAWDAFSGLKIASDPSCRLHMNKYNVIFLNVQKLWKYSEYNVKSLVKEIEGALCAEARIEFPNLPGYLKFLPDLLASAHQSTGVKFIFIIDEWDCVIRQNTTAEARSYYFDYLDAVLKGQPFVALAYMTGILPVYGGDSKLNMFDKSTMTRPKILAEYAGFTESEAKALCARHGMSYNEIKAWYEGYKLNGVNIYNPMSVVAAIKNKEIISHWTETDAFMSLGDFIRRDFDGLKETIVHLLDDFSNRATINPDKFSGNIGKMTSADEVLTVLAHLGYLGFDSTTSQIFTPNKEVAKEFEKAMSEPVWAGLIEMGGFSKQILESALQMDGVKVAAGIEKIHSRVSDMKKYNSELALSYVIQWSYMHSGKYYNRFNELHSGKGFIDGVFLPKPQYSHMPSLLIELKRNRSTKAAQKQIIEKDYVDKVREVAGDNILLIGINYSSSKQARTCEIRKYDPLIN